MSPLIVLVTVKFFASDLDEVLRFMDAMNDTGRLPRYWSEDAVTVDGQPFHEALGIPPVAWSNNYKAKD
jgi:hypothetical protein